MNAEQLQQLVRVQGELATIEALHRENETLREALEGIVALWTDPAPAQRQDVAYQRAVRIASEALASLATKRPDA